MANKKIFSYGNNGKRKIGHSKFDMGHEHIMSANFGGLHAAACFETLPDDYWDISDNTVTLLKPLTAPAFTRINQNFYGAYVRNQQIWKYWNDYISNGTAFGDVYGNNVTNQSLQNAWDIPSIPAPYLQFILKIGYGNAAPVWHFESSLTGSGPTTSNETLCAAFVKNVSLKNMSVNRVYRVTDAFYALLQVDPYNSSLNLAQPLISLHDIDFTHYAFDCWIYMTSDNKFYMLFSLYCSLRQWLAFRSVFPISSAEPHVDPTTIGSNSDPIYGAQTEHPYAWRFFADRCSSDPSTSQSAFLIEKSMYQTSAGTNIQKTLKSLDYYPRVIDSSVECVYRVPHLSSDPKIEIWQSIHSPYWGMRYTFVYNQSTNIGLVRPSNFLNIDSSTDFYWEIDAIALYGIGYDFQSLAESWSPNISYLGVSTFNFEDSLDCFAYNSGSILNITRNQSSHQYSYSINFGTLISFAGVLASYSASCACDFALFISPNISTFDFAPNTSFVTRESQALGFDGISMITYLCNNSSILLDEFGIKVDALSQRPFTDYRFELVNALPFFAYSKVWQDNFRNPVVSSPELDYSESNSLIFAPQSWYSDFVFNTNFLEPAIRPARYVGKTATDFRPNGWTLELTTFPRNSQGSLIHTHLPIRSFNDVFTILTGSNFDGLFSHLTNIDLNVFDTYLPTYYNGLLHMKYQNFNKDYFTSALLDPMSGANQVAVGSTINELRQAEAEQHWWERTAMYRSIKSWFEGTYGITPIELPLDSRITGTDHIDVNIGEVIQTSGSTPESPQGTRSGLGGCRGSGTLCHGHANEHGWILILVSHTVESQYLQNYDKMFDVKESFLDYPTIDFACLGNESILQKEVNYSTAPTKYFDLGKNLGTLNVNVGQYLPVFLRASSVYKGATNPVRLQSLSYGISNITNGAGTSLDNVFGFIPRYSSYKFKFDKVSGQFRHELAFWHTFKRYYSSPILCHEFVNWEMAADDDEINRIFAVSDDFLDDKFAIDCFINAHVDRALPFVCVPMSK
jgi:hypothetical protein